MADHHMWLGEVITRGGGAVGLIFALIQFWRSLMSKLDEKADRSTVDERVERLRQDYKNDLARLENNIEKMEKRINDLYADIYKEHSRHKD